MPAPSLAVTVTGSEPLRPPPASRPEASAVAVGGVGSLIVTSEPCRMWRIAPPVLTEHGEARSKQPARRIRVFALPAYLASAGKLARVTVLLATLTLLSG